MKKNNFIKSLFATLLLASPLVMADQKYPAADFQPEVVYQDKDYIAKNTATTAAPKTSEAVSASTSEADSKYPAANFQPQVIYSDANYKHHEAPVSKSSAAVEKSVAVADVKNEQVKKEESKPNYLVFLAIGAAAAFLLRNRFSGNKKAAQPSATAQTPATGLTGVARYLNKKAGTGVSRYLEKQVKSATAVTGVARYMAKQVTSAKTTATQAATGVEKYVRNRG